jgi:hypothetical protein
MTRVSCEKFDLEWKKKIDVNFVIFKKFFYVY